MRQPTNPSTFQSRLLKGLPGQVVLVLQGGGALGSYQVGVYQALQEAGIEPDWVIGTSIGAINASLIAGNEPKRRLELLDKFWSRVQRLPHWGLQGAPFGIGARWSHWTTVLQGVPGFFAPNPLAHMGNTVRLGADRAGYYSTAPLAHTLAEMVNFEHMNSGAPRLTVGAAHVRTSQMRYFDTREDRLDVRHIMASGALPPAFPPVRIDGELYWDGGILSNTPTEPVFDDNPRRDSVIFSVHLWNPVGAEPSTMADVLNRHKDIQYSSRIVSQISRQQQTHQLRHVINELASRLSADERNKSEIVEMLSHGCQTRMHVVQLLAPPMDHDDHTKDIDFSPGGIKRRWDAGYAHTKSVLARKPWLDEFDPGLAVVLHKVDPLTAV